MGNRKPTDLRPEAKHKNRSRLPMRLWRKMRTRARVPLKWDGVDVPVFCRLLLLRTIRTGILDLCIFRDGDMKGAMKIHAKGGYDESV
jgi:hypothetical protein